MEKIKVERSIIFQISYFRKTVVKKLRVQLKIAIQVGDRARERRAYRNLGKASTHWVNLKRPLSIKKKI